jgi:hypothetical protein
MAPTMALWYSPVTDQYGLFYLVGEKLWSLVVDSSEPPQQVRTVRHSIPNILSVYRGSHILHFETARSKMDVRNLRITNVETGAVEAFKVPASVLTSEDSDAIQGFTLVHPTLVIAFSSDCMHAFSTRRDVYPYWEQEIMHRFTLLRYDRYKWPTVQRVIDNTVSVLADDGSIVDVRFLNLSQYALGAPLEYLRFDVKKSMKDELNAYANDDNYSDYAMHMTAQRINAREVYMWLNDHTNEDLTVDTSLGVSVQGNLHMYDALHNVAIDRNLRLIRFERASRAPALERPITLLGDEPAAALGSRARRSRRSRRSRHTRRSKRSRTRKRSRSTRITRTKRTKRSRSRRSRARKHR